MQTVCKNIIGKYGCSEIRLYRATKYDFLFIHIQLELKHFKDWFEIYSQKVKFCLVWKEIINYRKKQKQNYIRYNTKFNTTEIPFRRLNIQSISIDLS